MKSLSFLQQASSNGGHQRRLAIGSEEVVDGKEFFGAEVKIEKGDELLRRFVVSIGASPIAPNNRSESLNLYVVLVGKPRARGVLA